MLSRILGMIRFMSFHSLMGRVRHIEIRMFLLLIGVAGLFFFCLGGEPIIFLIFYLGRVLDVLIRLVVLISQVLVHLGVI